MTAYIIAGAMYLILGIITFLVFRRNKRLELENDLLETEINEYKKVLKIEEHAIHSLEDIMKSKEEIERVENAKKEKLRKAANTNDVVNFLNNEL